ncbi:MAG: T9SS type A sorting domain-containing protein, partial [Bacteroidales bacterium]|nr:T9SS type A sorting domain-containing protein [Bacteroidales bacterium]
MTLVIPKVLLTTMLSRGDELAVYSGDGLLVGTAVYADETIAMPIWGQDKTAQAKSGLSNSVGFMVETYHHQTGKTTRSENIPYELGHVTFHENTLAVIKSLNLNLNLNLNLSLYPNPASDYLSLDISADEDRVGIIEIWNDLGQLVYSKAVSIIKGEQTQNIELTSFSAGLYQLRVSTGVQNMKFNFIHSK